MDKLPPELLVKIMLYLPPVDRLSCSLVCRRWAETMTSSQLLHDIWLDIAGHEMEAAKSVLVNSQRQYTMLLLYQADLSKFDSEFWGHIGASLRVLELQGSWWSNQVFYAILRQCTKLESLKLVESGFSIDDFALPEGTHNEELRDSLSHLKHLHLNINFIAETLDFLLGLMPNVTSIFLSSAFGMSDFLERLPSILKKNRIIRMGVHFSGMDQNRVTNFVDITAGSLEDLNIGNTSLTESAWDAIVKCTRLRRLRLHGLRGSFSASHLKKLVSNSPDLEVLELNDMTVVEDEDIMHFSELKKLRSLSLKCSYGIRATAESLIRLGEISTLVELDLSGLQVNSRVMRSLGCLLNLRALVINECVDPECFEAIRENFERLTKLDLGWVRHLTDADGMKLCCFKELRSLRFFGGRGFSDVTFERGVGSREIKSLNIRGCPITDDGLMSIAAHHDRLEELHLYDFQNITDVGVLALLRNEPQLKEVSLIDCAFLRRDWCADAGNFCPRLRFCNFWFPSDDYLSSD